MPKYINRNTLKKGTAIAGSALALGSGAVALANTAGKPAKTPTNPQGFAYQYGNLFQSMHKAPFEAIPERDINGEPIPNHFRKIQVKIPNADGAIKSVVTLEQVGKLYDTHWEATVDGQTYTDEPLAKPDERLTPDVLQKAADEINAAITGAEQR